ncbi:30S ribosomal protein S11 [Parcubacteria bacterium DG_74_2]|nr:MAG: 30S ribosomal protein S11 [Parcubacteria bacterium DG_74_2]
MGKKRVIRKTPGVSKGLKKEIKIKSTQKIEEGKIFISSSYNNTILTLTDFEGNVIIWTSAGHVGFSGTRKGTPYAASKAAELIANTVKKIGMNKIHILVKGIGGGRESALRTLAARDLNILTMKDITPTPHNGCRPPKVRRV